MVFTNWDMEMHLLLIFKMVISTSTPSTAKTIETLEHNLDLSQYENVIILDDGGTDCWCRHKMVELAARHKMEILLIECPQFLVWDSVYKRHRTWSLVKNNRSPLALLRWSQYFYSLIKNERDSEEEFILFHEYLKFLHQNKSSYQSAYFCPPYW